jgi:copper(I)-binding protein
MKRNKTRTLLIGALLAGVAAVAAIGASACGGDDAEPAASSIAIEGAWARKSPMNPGGMGGSNGMSGQPAGERGAAYMIIRNDGDADDALVSASSDVAETTEVHESRMEGETVTMQEVEQIPVPAEGSVELKPGGFHVMFIGLTQDLVPGETVEVTLHFEEAGDVVVQAEVRDE